MWCMLFVGNTNLTNLTELGDLTLEIIITFWVKFLRLGKCYVLRPYKGNHILGMIRRNITYKEIGLVVPLYKTIVRPRLEYWIK